MSWGRTLSIEIAPDAPPIREGEDEHELKLAFARAVFRLGDDWKRAGFSVFRGPDNYGRAMLAIGWINDFVVQDELDRLHEDPAETLPTDDQIEQMLITIAQKPGTSARDATQALALVWERRKQIKQSANMMINTGVINNNVLRVPAKPTTPEEREIYEIRLKASQLKLVADAKSSR